MKKRLITAAVAIVYALVVIYFYDTPLLPISLCVFGIICMHELAGVMQIKSKAIIAFSMIYAGLIPLFMGGEAAYNRAALRFGWTVVELPFDMGIVWRITTIVYILAMLFALLEHYKTIRFEKTATMIFGALAIPYALNLLLRFSCLDYYFEKFTEGDGVFIFIYALIVCWTFDGGAYFIGSKFGKHKMAKNISPKKSWEGYFGGILFSEICCVAYYFLYNTFAGDNKTTVINCLMIAVASPFLATLSILGDLSASAIKRNFGAKDFGNFFPGHGGILDRFDSVLYVTPIIYILINIIALT